MVPTKAKWSDELEVIWRESERLKTCEYGVFKDWSRPQLIAKALLLGVTGKLPDGVGPNMHPGPFKDGHGGGRHVRQVKRGAFWAVTTPAGLPSLVERPKEPFWSKVLTIGMP